MLGALVAALPIGCSDDEETTPAAPPVAGEYVAPAPDAARDALAQLSFHEVELEDVLGRFDVNGDGLVDEGDAADLAACIEAGQAPAGMACDLVPDGVIDEQDAYLLTLAVGESVPRSTAQMAAAAAALRDNASGGFEPALAAGFFDWNADGASDAADVNALATLLEGDLGPLDLDGSGVVTLRDVSVLAQRQAAALFSGGAAPEEDLNGDGASDEMDLALLSEVALYTAETSFGLLDVNHDGRLDERDFCLVSDAPTQQSFFGLLMPAAKAEAAFSAATPRFAFCRADGHPIARNLTYLDTPFVTKVHPKNLYANAVTDVPADYAPIDPSLAEGRELFVISTTESDRPLLAVSAPWDVTLAGGDQVTLLFGGPDFPAEASLVLPNGIASLDAPASLRSGHTQPTTERTVPLPAGLSEADSSAAAEIQQKLEAATATFAALIAGCPCSLTAAEREELVRYLLRTGHCLDSTLAVAEALLEAAEIEQARLSRLHISTSNEAAARWELLSDDIVYMEISKTLLLIAETGYDFTTGGPQKALEGAVSNLMSELATDGAADLLADSSAATATAANLEAALGAGAISGALGTMVTSGAGLSGGLSGFGKEFMKQTLQNLKKDLERSQLEAVIKTLIKMIPVYYVQYQQMVTEDAEHRATEYAQAHYQAMLRAAGLRAAVAVIGDAKATILDLRQQFLEKLQSAGCGVSVTTADPCSFDLETAIEAARAELASQSDAAAQAVDDAFSGAGREGTTSECTNGESRRRLDEATLSVASAARQLTEHARAQGSGVALAELEQQMHEASDGHREASADFAIFCNIFSETELSLEDITALRDAEDAAQQAKADFEQAVKDALAAYDACLANGGQAAGPCAFDGALAQQSPWASAAKCLGCLPSYAMNCCGDGKLQAGEECDPGSGVFPCDGGLVCTDACACESTGTGLPTSVEELANFLQVASLTGYAPLSLLTIIHSALNGGTQPVANDHTTLAGFFAGLVTLDQPTIDLFECGPGPGNPVDFTACPVSLLPLEPGPTIVIITSLAGPMPMSDTGNIYQYGFVFDSDGNPNNNYVPSAQYPNDFFRDTDLWLEANRTADLVWSVKATNAMNGAFTPVTTRAHVFIANDAMAIALPASEVQVAAPDFRITAFRHVGDWGASSPWDGSVFPAVADGLQPFP